MEKDSLSPEVLHEFEGQCEKLIGAVRIPVGLAGPLPIEINGKARREYMIPLATTESCLVASVNRGAKAIRESGSAFVSVENVGITRAPVFELGEVLTAAEVAHFLKEHEADFATVTKSTSRYLEYLSFSFELDAEHLFIKFRFDAKDAMGMNMATIASSAIAEQVIEPGLQANLVAISSNFCSDKKASLLNQKEGRGFRAKAWASIGSEHLKSVLKTDLATMLKVGELKLKKGSAYAQSLAENAHHANIAAALFAATGQDLAHVVESSLGWTRMESSGNDLRFEIELPSLLCGSLGGGTRLPDQKGFLAKMGLVGSTVPGESALELAGVMAAGILAGELSLMASLAEKSLSRVHKQFRRKT